MTDQNTPGAVSPVCGDVVAAIVGRGIGSAIGVNRRRSRRRVGVPVATAIAIVGVTISTVAVSAVRRGATLDGAKIGMVATLETMQSASTIETARSTGELARRCVRATTGRKASDRSGQRTTEGRTAGAQTGRRTTGTEDWRRTSEHRRRTRRRAELR
jgi:hypothetical protein